MLLVTMHGGNPGTHPVRNNIHAYDADGKQITASVLEDSPDVLLDELRAMKLVGDRLYVVIANKTQNRVVCYKGAGTSYRFLTDFASAKNCKAIQHPFDLTFDDGGQCYLSSQDTNVVTRLVCSPASHLTAASSQQDTGHSVAATAVVAGMTATPAPVAPALIPHGQFLPGTFVASSVANLCALPSTAVPLPQGLGYSADGDKKHSVRGIVWADEALYVADQPSNRVKAYDRSGMFCGQSNQVDCPIHLVVHEGILYVSGGNTLFRGRLPEKAGNFELSPVPGLRVKNASGMAFTDKGNAYIASRTENVILKFDSDFKPLKFSCDLPDNPEFLLHV